MNFELDMVMIEEGCRQSALAARILRRLPADVPVGYVADGRTAARARTGAADPFGEGKRRMVVMRRRGPFLMACPAGSAEFACCGYLVLVLASNCPMDCSYCFLQEYLADNPAFQVYANYADAFEELDRLGARLPGRALRVGTGELADSLAFEDMTGVAAEFVEYFAGRENLLFELKTKTDEIEGLLRVDPRGRTLVSWTLSPDRIFATSEHRTAPPAARLGAARRVLAAGYKVAFHFDPIIAYDGAERDYSDLIDELVEAIPPERIAFVSMGGLRMTPALRRAARTRHPEDPMLVGEEVLSPDGRYRAFAPQRVRLFRLLAERLKRRAARLPVYLCMESPAVHRRVLDGPPLAPGALGATLARA